MNGLVGFFRTVYDHSPKPNESPTLEPYVCIAETLNVSHGFGCQEDDTNFVFMLDFGAIRDYFDVNNQVARLVPPTMSGTDRFKALLHFYMGAPNMLRTATIFNHISTVELKGQGHLLASSLVPFSAPAVGNAQHRFLTVAVKKAVPTTMITVRVPLPVASPPSGPPVSVARPPVGRLAAPVVPLLSAASATPAQQSSSTSFAEQKKINLDQTIEQMRHEMRSACDELRRLREFDLKRVDSKANHVMRLGIAHRRLMMVL
jgi:hypothetical protein